jgi:integration host factor subunit alpha
MAGKTVTREDLSESVYQNVGFSRSESARRVGQVLGEIGDTLVRGRGCKAPRVRHVHPSQ